MNQLKFYYAQNKKELKKWGVLLFYSFLLAFVLRYIIIPLQMFSPGGAGVAQGIAYVITEFTTDASSSLSPEYLNTMYYWITYTLLNIPIIIFAYRVYGSKFISRILVLFFFGLIFSVFLTYTPGLNNTYLIDGLTELDLNDDGYDSVDKTIQTVVYISMAFFGGSIYGYASGRTFILDVTYPGFDPLARYLSREKGKNISKILFIFSIFTVIFFQTLIVSLNGEITSFQTFVNNLLFNPVVLASVTFLFTYSIIVGKIYNPNSKIVLKIITPKSDKISSLLVKINYHRGHTIENAVGGYTKNKLKVITMLINQEELTDVKNLISKIDETAFIYANPVNVASDLHSWKPIKFTDKNNQYNELKDIEEIITKLDVEQKVSEISGETKISDTENKKTKTSDTQKSKNNKNLEKKDSAITSSSKNKKGK